MTNIEVGDNIMNRRSVLGSLLAIFAAPFVAFGKTSHQPQPSRHRIKIVKVEWRAFGEYSKAFNQGWFPIATDEIPLWTQISAISMHHDWSGRYVYLRISHPSFPEVPIGGIIPEVQQPVMYRQCQLLF
jgi:hypothetical protein